MATPPKRCRPDGRLKKVAVEGNIAAGKSTFVNILKQASEEWEVVPEPVARWCNVQQSSGDDCEVKEGGKKSQMSL
ncbi:hypothetical protein TURU_022523 [Turdus rufiventris]|nr:hypothetical protein TURU_022523 [Turdus rufiventris]